MGKQIFQIDTRYQNLKVIGSGSYGVVCSADDVVGYDIYSIMILDCQTSSSY